MKKPKAKEVINLIEKLCYSYEDSDKSRRVAEKILDKIYQYSHLFSKCKNKHENWIEEFYQEKQDLEKD